MNFTHFLEESTNFLFLLQVLSLKQHLQGTVNLWACDLLKKIFGLPLPCEGKAFCDNSLCVLFSLFYSEFFSTSIKILVQYILSRHCPGGCYTESQLSLWLASACEV